MVRFYRILAVCFLAGVACGCNDGSGPPSEQVTGTLGSVTAPAWPKSLRAIDQGYPAKGDPCRRVGETPATAEFLDDTGALVACPGGSDAAVVQAITAAGGKVVAQVSGFSLISVPGDQSSQSTASGRAGDVLVAGTAFNATGGLPCARYAGQPTTDCKFGVSRAADRTATLTVFWPGGGSRAIFFDATGKAVGFDANQADGSAKALLKVSRNADLNLISIGDERYEVPDVVITGD